VLGTLVLFPSCKIPGLKLYFKLLGGTRARISIIFLASRALQIKLGTGSIDAGSVAEFSNAWHSGT
jgi:hypothetical protein